MNSIRIATEGGLRSAYIIKFENKLDANGPSTYWKSDEPVYTLDINKSTVFYYEATAKDVANVLGGVAIPVRMA